MSGISGRKDMNNYNAQIALGIASLLVSLVLASCSAGQANVATQQPALFAPAPGTPIAVGCGAGNVVVGDLNNDGKSDLLVACAEERKLTVLLGGSEG